MSSPFQLLPKPVIFSLSGSRTVRNYLIAPKLKASITGQSGMHVFPSTWPSQLKYIGTHYGAVAT